MLTVSTTCHQAAPDSSSPSFVFNQPQFHGPAGIGGVLSGNIIQSQSPSVPSDPAPSSEPKVPSKRRTRTQPNPEEDVYNLDADKEVLPSGGTLGERIKAALSNHDVKLLDDFRQELISGTVFIFRDEFGSILSGKDLTVLQAKMPTLPAPPPQFEEIYKLFNEFMIKGDLCKLPQYGSQWPHEMFVYIFQNVMHL